MKISVVVPVYNVEKYLIKCVLSIINQTYRNLEIILVNDGSTDKSSKLCNELKVRDNRIKVIHKKNGGLSSARNVGLNMATGKLISFIDSDDWIEPNFIEILYNGIVLHNADISTVQFSKVKDFKKIEFFSETRSKWMVFSKTEAMEVLFTSNLIGYSAVNKLYKKELFNEIRYPEGMLMEDKAIIYRLIHKSNIVSVNNSVKYHYFLRPDSIIRTSFNNKKFDSFIIHEEIIEFINEKYPSLIGAIRARYVHAAIKMLISMISSNHKVKEDYDRCINIIKRNEKYVFKEKKTKSYLKLITFLILIFPHIPLIFSKNKVISTLFNKITLS